MLMRRVVMAGVVMAGVVVVGMVMFGGRQHIGLAQDDRETAIDRRQHEARRDEAAQEQHAEHQQCRCSRGWRGSDPFEHSSHLAPKMLPLRGARNIFCT
jgi:hypothetical protein